MKEIEKNRRTLVRYWKALKSVAALKFLNSKIP